MKFSETRILTTHTGSLPRPPELTRLYTERVRGAEVDEHEIDEAGRKAVPWNVAKQIECGIDVVNNGEQQRESFVLYMRRRLSGLGGEGRRKGAADLDKYPVFQAMLRDLNAHKASVKNTDFLPKAIGKVSYLDTKAVEDECAVFAKALDENRGRYTEAFYTAPSPGLLSTIINDDYYHDRAAYLADLSAALKIEYETIHRHGFVLQVDCPDLAMERHMEFRDKPLSAYLEFVEAVVDSINGALENVPQDQARMHLCWGNYEGPHDEDLPLAEVLPIVLKMKVGGFVLPFANPRHAHEYHVLEHAKALDDRLIVAGVIDTLTNVVEHPEVIAERLERIVKAVGDPHRVLAGTDCGFDTSAGNSRVAPDVAWSKLKALSEGARIASKRIFGS